MSLAHRRPPMRQRTSYLTWGPYRPHLLAALIGGLAVVATGAVLAEAGRSLPSPRSQGLFRFCNGKCLCDGGTTSASLMQRVCPEGWQEVYSTTKRKVRLRKQHERRERIRKLKQAAPPPPATDWPSV